MKLNYFLSGIVNGQYLEVKGDGRFDKEQGGYEINLHSIIAPQGWDPGIILLICCGNTTFYSCKFKDEYLEESKDAFVPLRLSGIVGRKGYIQDENGKQVAELHAKGFLFKQGDVLYSRSVILDGFTNLGDYGGIKSIEDYCEQVIPGQENHATGLSNYIIHMNNGAVLKGSSLYPYVFENFNLKEKVGLNISNLDNGFQEFIESGRTGTTIRATVKQRVSAKAKQQIAEMA